MHSPSAAALILAACLGPAAGWAIDGAGTGQAVSQLQGAAAPLVVDIAVLDAGGRPVNDVDPGALQVRVDGAPRRVLSLRPVPASTRLTLLAIDESSFPPPVEKQVRAFSARLAGALEADARVALLTLPVASPRIAFTTDRASLGREIDRIAGRGAVEPQAAESQEGARPPVDRQSADRAGRERGEAADERPGQAPRDPAVGAGTQPAAALAPLLRVLSNLRNTPGPKTVILLSGATASRRDASSAEASAAAAPLVNAAIAARAVVDAVVLPSLAETADQPTWLEDLATATGGILVDARRDPEGAARRVAQKLAAACTLEIEASAGDYDGRPHGFSATVAAPKERILAPRRLYANRGTPAATVGASAGAPRPTPPAAPAPVATASPAAPASVPPAPPPARGSRTPAPRSAELESLLTSAAAYLADYENALSSVVAEEEYLQRHNRALSVVSKLGENLGAGVDYSILERRLKSDFLLVRGASTSAGWVPFRDVFEVDGKAVRDREDRLRKLFLETPATAFDQARRIMTEGARYNLGDVARTINIPTLPLLFVHPRNRDRFAWKRGGEQTVEGVRTRRLDFEELERPTLIRTSRNQDVPVSGTLWLDPATGRLVKGSVRASQTARNSMEMTVVFRPNAALGVWVPAEMTEFYQSPGQTIDATAKYSNFRRFQVKTEETITIPK